MANDITGKYFTQTDFSAREKEVLGQVMAETGFEIEQEIFRGFVYDKNKVGSLIYQGKWRGQSAVLKLQGLKPEIEEWQIMEFFKAQNKSQQVRLPILYAYQPWDAKKGYGYLITEFIDALNIFKMPLASDQEMAKFANFYQEYRTLAITKPWETIALASAQFTLVRVNKWLQFCKSKKRLAENQYLPYYEKFLILTNKHCPTIPLVFCHGHLSANDIFCPKDNEYVLTSNLFWAYRLQWYELAFNIWACLLAVSDLNFSPEQLIAYVNKWLAVYQQIPIVKLDPDFQRKINFLLAERMIGAILADLGVGDKFEGRENEQSLQHLLAIFQQFFDYLAA
jgi:hypothetical protein